MIEDIVTLVKGGVTHSSSGLLVIRNPDTYRNWGASLKYNPTLIEYEVNYCRIVWHNILLNRIKNLKNTS